MLGIPLLLLIYLVLGFTLAWVSNIVTKGDMEVKMGVLILFLTGVIAAVVRYGLSAVMPDLGAWPVPVINLAALIVMLKGIGRLNWTHSLIIAVIYSVVMTAILFGMTSCAGE